MQAEAILFDLDGVLYEGGRAVPGALQTLDWVRAAGIPHLFLSNTSSRPRSAIADRLAGMGMAVGEDDLLTPPRAAAEWARKTQPGPMALFVPAATRAEFEGLEILAEEAESGAGAVVVGDLGHDWDFARLNRAFRLLMAAPAPLVALGMTRYWQAEGGLQLDVGPMVAALQYATGREPLVMGKPATGFFGAALERLGVAATRTVMVGDDIVGDVQAAQRAGLRGVLVRTGKFREQDLDRGIAPDGIIGSIADLPAWWRQHGGRAHG